MKKKIKNCLDDIKKGLSRHGVLEDSMIKTFSNILSILKNIDEIKKNGYESYLQVFTAEQFVDTVTKEFNEVSLTIKNVSIGDIQWMQFLDKVLMLTKIFPAEFKALKDSATNQYKECAKMIVNDYDRIFADQSLIEKMKVKAKNPLER